MASGADVLAEMTLPPPAITDRTWREERQKVEVRLVQLVWWISLRGNAASPTALCVLSECLKKAHIVTLRLTGVHEAGRDGIMNSGSRAFFSRTFSLL